MAFSENREDQNTFRISRFRMGLVWLVLFLATSALVARLLWIQVLHPDPLIKAGDDRIVRNYNYMPPRGTIYDRNGTLLAISIPVKIIEGDAQRFHEYGIYDKKEVMAEIAKTLDVETSWLYEKLKDSSRRRVPLVKALEPDRALKLEKLAKDCFIISDSYKRSYPTGFVNASLVGILDGQGNGIYGVEQSFNSYLTAQGSVTKMRKDRYNNVIESIGTVKESSPGGNLILSIDERLQSLAYSELEKTVNFHKADCASAVLIDVKTGEILCMANYPSFDPNDRSVFDPSKAKNISVTDNFEPGSTVKPIVALAALEDGAVNWREVFDTRPFKVDGKLVRDSHSMDSGTLLDIIKYSSNTGMAHISMEIGPHKIMNLLERFGFGSRTASGLTGESSGILRSNRPFWAEIDKATLGFGYGISVTNLQLTSAYATLANDGLKHQVSILKLKTPDEGHQVLDRGHVMRMQNAMESVVAECTGKKAAINRYRVAGKTGTAKIAASGTYSSLYMSTFAGFAPIGNPRFAMVVVVKAPREGGFYGGTVSGPAFSEVMSRALQLYNVPPDRKLED